MSPWPPWFFIPIITQWGAVPLMSGALTVPGAPFSLQRDDRVMIWFCR